MYIVGFMLKLNVIIWIIQSDFISDLGIAFMLDPNFDPIEANLTQPDFLVLDL